MFTLGEDNLLSVQTDTVRIVCVSRLPPSKTAVAVVALAELMLQLIAFLNAATVIS